MMMLRRNMLTSTAWWECADLYLCRAFVMMLAIIIKTIDNSLGK